jgi:hypothetical protein
MTTPTAPADPAPAPAPAAPAPAAPAPAAPATAPANGQGDNSTARLENALSEARAELKDAKAALATAQQASMTEQERAVATARAEGKAEAEAAAAQRLAAAEFRIAATGRLANPDAALGVIDLSKLVQKNGEPNKQAITSLVEQLAATVPQTQQPGGHVIPAGPRAPVQGGDGDWLRTVQRPGRRRG